MRYFKFIFFGALLLTGSGCGRKSISALEKQNVCIVQANKSYSLKGSTDQEFQVQYLGCGGLYIRHAGQAILFDPFFSNQRLHTLAKSVLLGGRIRSRPGKIDYAKQRVIDSLHIDEATLREEVKGIFVAHGHYDHLMDVPYVFHHWFNGKPDVYLNESSYNTCANVIDRQGKLYNIEPLMAVREASGKSVDFPATDGSVIKVYPILSAHNPHSINIKFFSGSVMCPLPRFKTPESKTRANDWLEGRTLSFLLDVERNGTIAFRMFIQSSSCHFPDGFPPKALLEKKNVDVAVLGVASYHFSESTYPCAYLEGLRPERVMFIHWEDFFRNYKRKPKSVLATDIPRFFESIVPNCVDKKDYIMPSPGAVTTFRF